MRRSPAGAKAAAVRGLGVTAITTQPAIIVAVNVHGAFAARGADGLMYAGHQHDGLAMKSGQRLLAAGLLLGLAGSGCGNGGSQTAVRVVVDGKNLTSSEQAAVRSIWLFVVGDGDGGTIQRMYSTIGL